jgi:glyoxylase-like metal-dependent hydrolase (beta-lactamase superfamily II)
MDRRIRFALLAVFFLFLPGRSYAQSAADLVRQTAAAMGGLKALQNLHNQEVESEGKQFDSSSTQQPLGPTRQIGTFRYTLTRHLMQPRLRLKWEAQSLTGNPPARWVETINGDLGMLQEESGRRVEGEAAKPTRLHPGRLTTRMREEIRNPPKLILTALNSKSLKRLNDVECDGKTCTVVSFAHGGDEFRVYIEAQTRLPAQTEILEDDPLEGDSSYMLKYGDWRKVDGVMLPFSLRYELNGRALQEEQIKSIRQDVSLANDVFAIPNSVRSEKTDAEPVASQWILRRVAGGVSYQDMGRPAVIEWLQLAPGVHKIQGSSHATIVVEMRDYLVAIEGPLYEERTAPVIKSIHQKFPDKPIRYVIPTHHHLDHAGGIRAFMAEGAVVVVPFSAQAFYQKVARAPHTRRPDSLEVNRTVVTIESFGGGPKIIGDGTRSVEVHPLPLPHADDLVVVYLPKERLLVEADHISPRDGQVRSGPRVDEFVPAVDKLRLDIATIVGIHGDQATLAAAKAAVKK